MTTARGVTLVELMVVLVVLGLVTAVSGLAIASLRLPQTPRSDLERGRAEAIRTGRSVMVDSVRFLPDGRAVGRGVDPLTGAINGW